MPEEQPYMINPSRHGCVHCCREKQNKAFNETTAHIALFPHRRCRAFLLLGLEVFLKAASIYVHVKFIPTINWHVPQAFHIQMPETSHIIFLPFFALHSSFLSSQHWWDNTWEHPTASWQNPYNPIQMAADPLSITSSICPLSSLSSHPPLGEQCPR